ncbi:MAG: LuxR family transcriptional regulator, partial [Sphingobacteriales bacterium]
DKLGIQEEKQRVEKFFDCNYSAFGGDADVTHCGKLGDREVVKCDQRDSCQFEGKLCKLPNRLTKREAQIARAIAKAMMDAEITADLFISQNTLRNHKNNIENKIGQTGKIAIAVWTEKVGLI